MSTAPIEADRLRNCWAWEVARLGSFDQVPVNLRALAGRLAAVAAQPVGARAANRLLTIAHELQARAGRAPFVPLSAAEVGALQGRLMDIADAIDAAAIAKFGGTAA